MSRWIFVCLCLLPLLVLGGEPQPPAVDTSRGDRPLEAYFRAETARLAATCLTDVKTLEDWTSRREELRRQFREMLGLDPLPARTPLAATVTGTIDHPEFTVEKLHYQSSPGLYVTGNLYVPKGLTAPAPAILYVCGHSKQKEGNISFGNKAGYQHHGAWYARNGYVCLTIDTIQLGEIEGYHHGTHNLNQWWWNARGYTPAGVEAWNGMRGIDYLQTRPEVDPARIGVTGRSGGGAYSWWIAALDDRVQAAVPVAGITDLENHVVDGVVDGHCDCMFQVNTYRWDFAQVAALVAPRPLLISNTDKDTIFPLEGVVRVHEKVRRIYRLYGAEKNLGLQITEGPHLDTQELHIHSFRWFNRFLKNDPQSQVEKTAVKFFAPAQLRVFDMLPADELVTRVAESFVPPASPLTLPVSASTWADRRDKVLAGLREKAFRGWPSSDAVPAVPTVTPAFDVERDGIHLLAFDLESQPHVPLRLYVAGRAGLKPADLDLVVLNVLDATGWSEFLAGMRHAFADQFRDEPPVEPNPKTFDENRKMFETFRWGMAWVAPRGIGPGAWNPAERKQNGIRRRFQLLGQTVDGMRVWDTRRALQSLRQVEGLKSRPIWLQGEREMAGVALYASLFEPEIARLDLWRLPTSHRNGPDFLNVLRVCDTPLALAIAAERTPVRIYQTNLEGWEFPVGVANSLGWPEKQIQLRKIPD
ncbi:MAG: prolyl oligopeptidase family serine peptidase [Planctomycetota bacterium]|nr:prolyl oligopeptidase family serine peptidase [Planctomycetota bacterium]